MAKRTRVPVFPRYLFPYRIDLTDERFPRLLGLVCVLLACYLFIALVSYLFTWEADQPLILDRTLTQILFASEHVSNWLGRLGAWVSHRFVYDGFGLAAFAFVVVLFMSGRSLMKSRTVRPLYAIYFFVFGGMMITSTLLSFIFHRNFASAFPWGGSVGDGIQDWLVGIIGTSGMILLILFTLVAALLWVFNLNFEDWNTSELLDNVEERTGVSLAFLRRGQDGSEDPAETAPRAPRRTSRPTNGEAQPDTTSPPATDTEATTATPSTNPFDRRNKPQPVRQMTLPPNPDTAVEEVLQGQMDLALRGATPSVRRNASLTTGASSNSEFEIEIPRGETPTLPEPETDIPLITHIPTAAEMGNLEPYDPTLDLPSYEHPVVTLLESYENNKIEIDRAELESNKDQIIETLLNYKIEITKIKATIGPTVTLYEIIPAAGVRIAKIKNLEDDIALNLSALGIRIIAPIPGRGTIGIEVPNKSKQIVSLREVLLSERFKLAKMDLPIALGKTISNEVFVADGYGNRRVIVFDANTGAYKRHWGAYGNKPDDKASKARQATGAGPQQFNTPHGIEVSNDGIVYVTDRANNRLQSFTLEGKFLKEGFIKRESQGTGTAFGVALSTDPAQRFLYIADGSNERIAILDRKSLEEIGHIGGPGRKAGEFFHLHSLDVDPQGNTTTGLGIDKRELKRDIYDLLLHHSPIDDVLQNTEIPGLALIPATINLAGAEIELVLLDFGATRE